MVIFHYGLGFWFPGLSLSNIPDYQFIWVLLQRVIPSGVIVSWFWNNFKLIVYYDDSFSCEAIPWLVDPLGALLNVLESLVDLPFDPHSLVDLFWRIFLSFLGLTYLHVSFSCLDKCNLLWPN